MKNYDLNLIFTFDSDYSNKAQFANENHLKIIQIDNDENGYPRFKFVEITPTIDEEMNDLKFWFNKYYAEHEQKYRRLYTLKQSTDDGKDPNQALRDLYFEAEEKRKRIQELEAQIQSLSKSKS